MNEEQDKISLAEKSVEKPAETQSQKTASAEVKKKTPKRSVDKKQQVDAAMQNFTQKTVQAPAKKKHGWVSFVVLFAVIGLGIYFMVAFGLTADEDSVSSLGDILSNLNVKYAVISLAVLLAVMLIESGKFAIITKAVTGHFKFRNSIKVALLGKYYDDITPFGSGGQPMQIYYLHKKGNSTGVSSAIVLIKYFANMMCWLTICFFLMILNKDAIPTYVPDVNWQQIFIIAGWIGWAVNALLPISIVLCAVFPKVTNKILTFFVNIATNVSLSVVKRSEKRTGKSQMQRKIKILRRKARWINSVHSAVSDFRSSFIVLSHKPLHFIMLIVSCLVEQFLTWSFPYFILIAFANGIVEPSAEIMFAIMTLNVFVAMAVSVVPTPGNSGVMENFILVAFRTLAQSALIGFWVVFTWRFLTYYIYILIGLGITIFEVIRNVVRNKRLKKQSETDGENGKLSQ